MTNKGEKNGLDIVIGEYYQGLNSEVIKMAIFNPGNPPTGQAFKNAVDAVRKILNGNTYIKNEVDRQVAAANPQSTNAWETARGNALKDAIQKNALFRTAVKTDGTAGPVLDPNL